MPPLGLDLSEADATLLDDRVVIWDEHDAVQLYRAGFYGKLVDGKMLQLSLLECAYLMQLGLPVEDGATNRRFTTLPVSYTHLRAHETRHDLVCRLLLEKKKKIYK